MGLFVFLICFTASVIGGICGIGGGVIMKPLLDALGIMSVSSISFLSGLTVMSMAMVSVFGQRKTQLVDLRIGSFLTLGAICGGILGNALFQTAKAAAGNDRFVGMVQALVLAFITLFTLIYNLILSNHSRTCQIQNAILCILIGGGMGALSSFLGIGGGPINLAILNFAFSMEPKKAAANSLYIILFSQISNLVLTVAKGTVPDFPWIYLLLMVLAGFSGGMVGSRISKNISEKRTKILFAVLLFAIILICIYNAVHFFI